MCVKEIYKLKKRKEGIKVKKYVLAVLNPITNQIHFGKPNTLELVKKEAELFKDTRIITEEEYLDIIKGFMYNEE